MGEGVRGTDGPQSRRETEAHCPGFSVSEALQLCVTAHSYHKLLPLCSCSGRAEVSNQVLL